MKLLLNIKKLTKDIVGNKYIVRSESWNCSGQIGEIKDMWY